MVEIASILPPFIDGAYRITQAAVINDYERRKNPLYRRLRSVFGQGREYELLIENDKCIGKEIEERDFEREEEIAGHRESQNHPFLRVDLVGGIDGQFHIAEIEVDKLHGFGYASLIRNMAKGNSLGDGLISKVSFRSDSIPTGIILSGSEEFYEVEADYFSRQVGKAGGDLTVIPQRDLGIDSGGIFSLSKPERYIDQVLTIPQLQSSCRGVRYDAPAAHEALDSLVTNGKLTTLSRQNNLLSEKTLLGVIYNPQCDPDLEELLLKVFNPEDLDSLRRYIPKTESLGLSGRHKRAIEILQNSSENFFVKDVKGSGARGIGRPGDLEAQMRLINEKPKSVILQENISPEFHKLNFTDLYSGDSGNDDFTIRYGLFVDSEGQIVDLALTASPGVVAHGGRDSIMLPLTL